nr:hypothetical protein asmbl_3 [uncultured bacterium]
MSTHATNLLYRLTMSAVSAVLGTAVLASAATFRTTTDTMQVNGDEVKTSTQVRIDDALRTIAGSRQVGRNEVSWRVPGLGEARLVIPESRAARVACPADRLCFWDNTDYGGDLRHYPRCPRKGTDYYLEGFRDRAESWQNNTSWTAWVYNYRTPIRQRLWTMNTGFYSPDVGGGNRNKADYFRC